MSRTTPWGDVGTAPKPDPIRLGDTLERVYEEVWRQDELARQGRFGGKHILVTGPDVARLAVLAEEFGEVSREVTEDLHGVVPQRLVALTEELIQVAACAVNWATALELDRIEAEEQEGRR